MISVEILQDSRHLFIKGCGGKQKAPPYFWSPLSLRVHVSVMGRIPTSP